MIKEIYLAGGCFWGVEKYFSIQTGIIDTQVGYANGNTENPTYEEVCSQTTGFTEVVKIIYDSNLVNLQDIIHAYFNIIDPLSINKQGNDIGTNYRTGMYYVNDDDFIILNNAKKDLDNNLKQKSVIEILKLQNYYPAEEYHQKYLNKNPNGYCHLPKNLFVKQY